MQGGTGYGDGDWSRCAGKNKGHSNVRIHFSFRVKESELIFYKHLRLLL